MWMAPEQFTVNGIYPDDVLEHEGNHLVLAVHIDQYRGGIRIEEIMFLPYDASIFLVERHQGVFCAANHQDHYVLVRQRLAGITINHYRALEFFVKVVGPERLARFLIETVKLTGDANCVNSIPHQHGHGVRSRTVDFNGDPYLIRLRHRVAVNWLRFTARR